MSIFLNSKSKIIFFKYKYYYYYLLLYNMNLIFLLSYYDKKIKNNLLFGKIGSKLK